MENYQVFISYRRDGGDTMAGRIADRLTALGYTVFYDVESMRSGAFNDQIFEAMDKCTDVIVVLPPNGLDRCVNEDDWVRQELSHAIRTHKNIVPVMMQNFVFPQELPVELAALRYMEGVVAHGEYFDAVMQKITTMLKSQVTSKKIVDEILFFFKQNKWPHTVQVTQSSSVFVNFSRVNMPNLPRLSMCIYVGADNFISIIGRNIKSFAREDYPKVYKLLCDINYMSPFVLFYASEREDTLFIEARYDILPFIDNQVGVCMHMVEEMAREVNRFYPKIAEVLGE